MINVLVTGAAGQLGQSFAGLEKNAMQLGIKLRLVNKEELDITNEKAIDFILKDYRPDVVINTAAFTGVDKAEQHTELAHRVNAIGPALLADACNAKKIWLIQVSTDYVFDGESKDSYSEEDAVNPLGVYGKTKLAGEQAVIAANSDFLVLRTSWVFSEYGNNFFKTMLRLAKERDRLSIVNDQYGGPTYAPDIAWVLLQLIVIKCKQSRAVKGGVYHFSGEPVVTWYQFAQQILTAAVELGFLSSLPELRAIRTAEFPTPAKRPANSALELDKIRALLGQELHNDWKIAVKKALRALN